MSLRWTEPRQAPSVRRDQLPPILRKRDPDLISKVAPIYSLISDIYFRAEVEGMEHVSTGPSLMVSTHNGSIAMPDAIAMWVAFWRRFGTDPPGYGMAHKAALGIPGVGPFLEKMGGVPASPENAATVLEAGFPLSICPGGDIDALKPFRLRHRILFGNRRGFIRMAIRQQVPIVPIVSVGAHETQIILNDGRKLAEASGFARFLRIKTVPLSLSFPFGLTVAGIPSIPIPSKVKVRVLPPIELDESPEAAGDEPTVQRCFEHVRSTMQSGLDDLASQRKWPFIG